MLGLAQTQHSTSPKLHNPYCEAWWWQHHVVGMFLISTDWVTCKKEGKMDGAKYRKIREENLLPSATKLKLGRKFTFQDDNDPKHTTQATQSEPRPKSNQK